MKLSLVIPVYNAEKYISNCLDSVINQSYQDIEIILINDGSKDQSLFICEKFAVKDIRIKIINQSNGGPAKARNEGIKIAEGEYIGFVDADDIIKPDFYETLMGLAASTKSDVIMSDIIRTDGTSKNIIKSAVPKDRVLEKDGIIEHVIRQFFDGDTSNIPVLWNKIYKRTFLETHNVRMDETRVRAEDYWFNLNVLYHANSFFATDYAGYVYNTAVIESIMKSFRDDQYEGFLRSRRELAEYNKKFNFVIDYRKWDNDFVNNANEYILLALHHGRKDIAKKVLQDDTLKGCFRNYQPNSLHTKIISFLMNMNLPFLALPVFKIWSKKLQ